MPESRLYLNLETGHEQNLVPAAIGALIARMRQEEVDGTPALSHRMPTLVRQQAGKHIIHPILSTLGGDFAGWPVDFSNRAIIQSTRHKHNGGWGLQARRGRLDRLQIAMRLDTNDPDSYIGVPVLMFPGLSQPREQGVHDWLEATPGYTGLQVDVGQAVPMPGAQREMTLTGTAEDGHKELIPLSMAAASAFIGIVGLVVEIDMERQQAAQARAAAPRP